MSGGSSYRIVVVGLKPGSDNKLRKAIDMLQDEKIWFCLSRLGDDDKFSAAGIVQKPSAVKSMFVNPVREILTIVIGDKPKFTDNDWTGSDGQLLDFITVDPELWGPLELESHFQKLLKKMAQRRYDALQRGLNGK